MNGIRAGMTRLAEDHRMLMGALAATLAFHGGLLAAGTFRRTYDAYVHIFFADHYLRGWFETWEPRWYTGFTVTSYPPGTHQLVALVSHAVGLEAAFAVVQLVGILLVVVGVYRVTETVSSRRASGYAAWLTVFSTSIAEAVHVFGQLPTIWALGMLLNAVPFVRKWVAIGDRRDLVAATSLLAGTTALHHVTTLFGAVFFLGPTMASALLERLRTPHLDENSSRPPRVRPATIVPLVARRLRRIMRPLGRVGVLGTLVVLVLVAVVLPYWIWTSTDPISQVPIPHGSRANFLEDLNTGVVFWLIPWGPMLLVLPYVLVRGIGSAAWPYVASLGLLTVLGTGGTTPIPRMLLGGAFDILTLDRFTFWATILVLPFAGTAVQDLVHGDLRRRLTGAFGHPATAALKAGLAVTVVASAVFAANLTQFRSMQPDPIDPAPIVSFLEKDQHDRWRYLTLGFGDQMAWLSAQTTAQTVDGNYHSARRLPELITTPVERLEGAKFRGIPGLGSLQQFLGTPERYHLKYVFSNDQFYDPLLHFSGWRRLQRLENGVVVWEREDVPPLPAAVSRPDLPALHGLMWGLLPPAALLSAAVGATAGWWRPRPPRTPRSLVAALDERLRNAAVIHPDEDGRAGSWKEPFKRLGRRLAPSDTHLKLAGALAGLGLVAAFGLLSTGGTPGPTDVIEGFYEDLDYRRFEDAWRRLHPADRPSLDEYLLRISVEDGLVDSYSALESVTVSRLRPHPGGATADVDVVWMTALAEYRSTHSVDLVEDGDGWWIRLPEPDPSEAVERLARRVEVVYEAPGRRTVTAGSTEYDDVLDRPELALGTARLVLADGRPVVIGSVRNVDADPASVTVTAGLGSPLEAKPLRGNARLFVQHSLLPGEWSPYRVDFEGVAGLETGDFDPTEFTEVPIPADVDSVRVDAAAVVTTRGLGRPVSVRDISTTLEASNVVRLEGEILNLGTTDVTVTGLIVSLFDLDGELIWVDWILVSDSTRPGLTTRFSDVLTARERIEPVDAGVAGFANGLSVDRSEPSPSYFPLPAESGYSGFMLTAAVFQRPTS